MMRPGPIGFVAQSGIFVGALLRHLSSHEGLQISKGLGLGNKVDVDEADALEYLGRDSQTRIIGLYLEDVRDGRRFIQVARETVSQKPVLLLKGGRTEAGARSTASHTASMAVADDVLNGALHQAGVIRVPSIDELLRTLRGFLTMPLPQGPNLALVTFSGAQAIMSIDRAVEEGLSLATLEESTRQRILGVISIPSKAKNPIDIYPDMAVHGVDRTMNTILSALMDDRNVHGIIAISFANEGAQVYHPVVEALKGKVTKPLFLASWGVKTTFWPLRAIWKKMGSPVTICPKWRCRCSRGCGAMPKYACV